MNKELLNLRPIGLICPFCGQRHDLDVDGHLGYFYGGDQLRVLCQCMSLEFALDFTDRYGETMHVYFETACDRVGPVSKTINTAEMVQDHEEPILRFKIPIEVSETVGTSGCCNSRNCSHYYSCNFRKMRDAGASTHMEVEMGIIFRPDDYFKIIEKRPERTETSMKQNTNSNPANLIVDRIWRCSPEENFRDLTAKVKEHSDVLKWAVPAGIVYAASRILKDKTLSGSGETITEVCQEKLGFVLEPLKDKKSLKILGGLGLVSAACYSAYKIFTDDEKKTSLTEKFSKLEEAKKKFRWTQPALEGLLPVATSVVIIYMMTQQPEWYVKAKSKVCEMLGTASDKVGPYIEMGKIYIADNLNINLDDPETLGKIKLFSILAAVVGISALVYGKQILTAKGKGEKFYGFVSELTEAMKKVLPTGFAALTTFLVTREVLEDIDEAETLDDAEDASEEESEKDPNMDFEVVEDTTGEQQDPEDTE